MYLKLAFLVSLSGVFGSLYFSEVVGYPPCDLCWWQRVALYPLAFVFAVGIWIEDKKVSKYAWPLTVFGLLVSIYHNLKYSGWIEAEIIPCSSAGVSCTTKQLELFGFITIPLLSLASFLLIATFLLLDKRSEA